MGSYKAGIETKRAILDACIKLFNEYGFEKTTYKMISDETGILPGSIIYHFKSKEALLQAVFQDFSDRSFRYARDELGKTNVSKDYLVAFFSVYINYYMAFHADQYTRFMSSALINGAISVDSYKNDYLVYYRSFFKIAEDDPQHMLNLTACYEADNGLLLYVIQNIDTFRASYSFEQIAEYSIRLIARFFTVKASMFDAAIAEFNTFAASYEWPHVTATLCR